MKWSEVDMSSWCEDVDIEIDSGGSLPSHELECWERSICDWITQVKRVESQRVENTYAHI